MFSLASGWENVRGCPVKHTAAVGGDERPAWQEPARPYRAAGKEGVARAVEHPLYAMQRGGEDAMMMGHTHFVSALAVLIFFFFFTELS